MCTVYSVIKQSQINERVMSEPLVRGGEESPEGGGGADVSICRRRQGHLLKSTQSVTRRRPPLLVPLFFFKSLSPTNVYRVLYEQTVSQQMPVSDSAETSVYHG